MTCAALPCFGQADTSRATQLEKVIVTGERETTPVTEPTELTEKLLDVPGQFGDPLQTIYSLPGIIQSEEAGGEPAVRGSGPDDNAFLVDFLPASYIFHDFGFSIFNENVLRDFGIRSAGFGSRYGKATGAVFDVSLREPRVQPWAYTLDASFLRVGAFAEGKLTDSQSMYVSFRESLVHLLLELRADAIEEEEDISFDTYPRARDAQIKYSWAIDEHNRLSVLAMGAQDETEVRLGNESDIALIDPGVAGSVTLATGFASLGVNWLYDDGVNRLRTAGGYLAENRDLSSGSGAEYSKSDIVRSTLKSHYDRRLGQSHTLGLGGEYQQAVYDYDLLFRYRSCTNFTPDCRVNRGPLTSASTSTTINSSEAFIEDRWQIGRTVAFTPGLHFTHNDYLDESYVEPRAAADWTVSSNWMLQASWGEYHQLPRIGQIIPTFGNPTLVSPSATHYVLGVNNRLDGGWSWSTDAYYKELDDLVVDVTTGQQYLNRATGEAYGVELMINKNRGASMATFMNRLYGWLSLSLARTTRYNQLTDTSAVFEFDTPVIANFVLNYQIADAWHIGLRWNLRSGLPYTPIVGNKPNPDFPGFYLPVYGDLNSSRASPYHRLDLRGEYEWTSGRLRGSVYVDIINAYNRRNGGAVQYKPKPGTSEFELEEEESLPLLPSIGVKLSF